MLSAKGVKQFITKLKTIIGFAPLYHLIGLVLLQTLLAFEALKSFVFGLLRVDP